MQSRFDCASADSQRTFWYNIRLRLATLEGVRNMFYEYATRVADKLEILQRIPMEAGHNEYEFEDVVYDTAERTESESSERDDAWKCVSDCKKQTVLLRANLFISKELLCFEISILEFVCNVSRVVIRVYSYVYHIS